MERSVNARGILCANQAYAFEFCSKEGCIVNVLQRNRRWPRPLAWPRVALFPPVNQILLHQVRFHLCLPSPNPVAIEAIVAAEVGDDKQCEHFSRGILVCHH